MATTTNSTSSTTTSDFSMTSTFADPFPSSTGGFPGGQGGGNGRGGNNGQQQQSLDGGNSASLYLYTFLATLVLLLGVSAAIVIRSLLLRRRHRLMIEEAIRNGTWVPPPVGGGRGGKDIGVKPTMHEVWLGGGWVDVKKMEKHEGEDAEHPLTMKEKDAKERMSWKEVMPFSLQLLSSTAPPSASSASPSASNPHLAHATSAADLNNSSDHSNNNNNTSNANNSNTRTSRILSTLRQLPRNAYHIAVPRDSVPISQEEVAHRQAPWNNPFFSLSLNVPGAVGSTGPEETLPPQILPTPESQATLRVSLLIAMPSPHSMVGKEGGEEELPVVEMGVAEVEMGGGGGKREGKRRSEEV